MANHGQYVRLWSKATVHAYNHPFRNWVVIGAASQWETCWTSVGGCLYWCPSAEVWVAVSASNRLMAGTRFGHLVKWLNRGGNWMAAHGRVNVRPSAE